MDLYFFPVVTYFKTKPEPKNISEDFFSFTFTVPFGRNSLVQTSVSFKLYLVFGFHIKKNLGR